MQVHRLVATAMDPLVPTKEPKEPITVTPNEIIYHRRVRVMEHARSTSVSEACRTFGVSRTTFSRWQHWLTSDCHLTVLQGVLPAWALGPVSGKSETHKRGS